jgi:uncharacterized RDD family membrane protein YckC
VENIAWYYEVDGACIGPVTQDALCHLLRTAAIGPTTRVRCDALPYWLLAAQVPGFQAVVSPPPLPAGAVAVAAQPPALPAGTHLVQPDPIIPTVLQGVVPPQPGQGAPALPAGLPAPAAGLPSAPIGGAAAVAAQPNYLVWENPAAQAAAAAAAGIAPQEAEPGASVMLAVRPAAPSFESSTAAAFAARRVNEENVPQVRPWVRFWARWIDAAVAGFAFAICCLGWAALAGPMGKWTFLLSVGFFLMWIFVEAFMLSEMGTTIGKAVLGITVRNEQGEDLTYGQAVARGFRVLYRGLGLGVPFVNLIAMIVSYFRLTGNGSTTWDRDGRLTVSHSRIGVGRGVAAFVCIVGLYAMTVFASSIAASATDPGVPVVAAAALPQVPVTNIPTIAISTPPAPVPAPTPPPQPTPPPLSIRAVTPNPDRRITVKRKAPPSGKAPAGAKAPAAAPKGTAGAKPPSSSAGPAAQTPARPSSSAAATPAAATTRARRAERTQTASAAPTGSGQEFDSSDGRIIIIRRTR